MKGIERGAVKLKVSLELHMKGRPGMCLNVVDLYSERGREQYAKKANGQVGVEEETALRTWGNSFGLGGRVGGQEGRRPQAGGHDGGGEGPKPWRS